VSGGLAEQASGQESKRVRQAALGTTVDELGANNCLWRRWLANTLRLAASCPLHWLLTPAGQSQLTSAGGESRAPN